MSFRPSLRRLLVPLVLTVVIAGCATPPPAPLASAPQALASNEGVVLLKVTCLDRVSLLNPQWQIIRFKDMATGKIVKLSNQGSTGDLHSTFVDSLPAGRYSIDGLEADGATPMTFGLAIGLLINGISGSHEQASAQDTFTVVPGQLTNLGFVLNAPGDQPVNVVVDDEEAKRSDLNSLDAASRARLSSMTSRGWDQPADDAHAREAADQLIRTRMHRLAIDLPGDGRVLIGTALGEVHERLSDGQWRTLRSGLADAIASVRGLPDGRVLAGVDGDRYVLFEADGREQTLAVPGGAMITAAEPLTQGGVAVLAQKFVSMVGPTMAPIPAEDHIFVLTDPAVPQAARELSPGPTPDQGTSPGMFFDGRSLLVWTNEPGITRNGHLYRMDPASGTSRREDAPFWLRTIYRTADGHLVRMRVNGLSTYADFSSDGKSWTTGQNSQPVFGTSYADTRDGWGLELTSRGWSTVSSVLEQTADAGKTWKAAGKTIDLYQDGKMLGVTAGRIWVYTGQAVLSTADQGTTWNTEWPRPE